jgi:hypothetical protein
MKIIVLIDIADFLGLGRKDNLAVSRKDAQLHEPFISANRSETVLQPFWKYIPGQVLIFQPQSSNHITGVSNSLAFGLRGQQVSVVRVYDKELVARQKDGNCQRKKKQVAQQFNTEHIEVDSLRIFDRRI